MTPLQLEIQEAINQTYAVSQSFFAYVLTVPLLILAGGLLIFYLGGVLLSIWEKIEKARSGNLYYGNYEEPVQWHYPPQPETPPQPMPPAPLAPRHKRRVTCGYCNTKNSARRSTCASCGAPLS